MTPATPTPMSTNASNTLTAAMMPSNRLVVPSSADIRCSLEGRRLAWTRVAWRLLTRFPERIVQQFPAFIGHAGRLLDRRPEADQLARDVLERRIDLTPKRSPAISEEQVPDPSSNHRACHDCRQRSVVHHASLLVSHQRRGSSCVPRGIYKTAGEISSSRSGEPVSFQDGSLMLALLQGHPSATDALTRVARTAARHDDRGRAAHICRAAPILVSRVWR